MSATLEQVANQSFDYIICGGGTAGLTLAARLTEDPNVSVLVLEAGKANLNDPALLRAASFATHFGNTDYTWTYQTTKQAKTNAQYFWQRGKGLGGSSAINFLCWTRPPAGDIDDIEKLGNPGWNWKNHHKYMARTEGFVQPSDEFAKRNRLNFDNWQVGRQGPLELTYPPTIAAAELKIQEAIIKAGIPVAPKPVDGDPAGAYFGLNTYDLKTNTRSYAATAFYLPVKDRSNLTVLVSASVHQILSKTGSGGNLAATGVEFEYDGKTHVVNAKKEVVLSTGSLKTPQILELSGIGSKEVLNKIEVPVKVELPGVGNNVQEHAFVCFNFELRDDVEFETLDLLRDPATAEKHLKLRESGKGIYTCGIVGFNFASLKTISPNNSDAIIKAARENIEKNASSYPPGLYEQYKIQLDRFERGSPGCEIISIPGYLPSSNPPEPGKRYVTIIAAMNHFWSRGTIHATSKDPHVEPEFDPKYLDLDVDLQVWLEMVKFVRNFSKNAPFKDLMAKELSPGLDVQDDAQFTEWIKKFLSTTWHTSSSCSMLPKASNGVVDPNLKVYGTDNIRVVDLSILPLHIAAHPQASLYGIAEQAADIIKGKFTA